MHNRGIDWAKEIADQQETDYVFGASSPVCIALIPQAEREAYLPKGELQRGREDFMDCATRSPLNELEAKFTYLYRNGLMSTANASWLLDKGYVVMRGGNPCVEFSDRFIAIRSGTTRQGNSLKAPLQAIHTHGLIPKKMLPAKGTMSWVQYHRASDIRIEMDVLGMQFLNRFPIGYERVPREQFAALIDTDMIGVAGYAWPDPINGEYPKSLANPNHAFLYFRTPRFHIFDNYEEGKDDWVKKLADDYSLMDYGYRVFVDEQHVKDRTLIDLVIALLVRGKPADAMRLITHTLGACFN